MDGTTTRRGRTTVLLVVAGLVVVALVVAALVRTLGPAGSALPPRGATVAVIGDSFSAGTAYGGQGDANWAALLAAQQGWRVENLAAGGVGYVATLPGIPAFAGQVDGALAAGPDAVVVEGSRNDVVVPPEAVTAAAGALYRTLREQRPDATLVVIGPIWSDGAPPPEVLRLRDAVRSAALAADAVFVDPVAEGWFARPAGLIGPDGVHPDDAGHRLMTDRVAQALRRS